MMQEPAPTTIEEYELSDVDLSLSELQIWISSALAPLVGHEAVTDDDGDFPVLLDSGVVYIRAVDDEEEIHFFAPLVENVSRTDYASFVVHALNRAHPVIKFFLSGNSIGVRAVLYADPPIESHLLRCISQFEDVMAQGGQIADDVDGVFVWAGDSAMESAGSAEGEELPTPVMVLVQLDAEGDHSLSPAEVARICHDDAEAILQYIRVVEEQMITWRTRADEAVSSGDSEEAEACLHEAQGWEKTARDLRGALRHVALN
ncbi:hypothetical protein [Gordonia sp. OPL2]|uniref:T3SS (YopN, CesT) and YbjN peptide-binding chaperone 1 n=1 Tax=Gordonia sp. OPL2 TaxID=2486274 RepID=UPI0021CCF6D1|nr:hypothetical protein [Gordonia sp. OPL2]